MPIESTGLARKAHFPDGYATTPVVVNGVVYLQDLESNVMAIRDEVQNLWGDPTVNSGGGLWDPPSFDSQGNLYIGIANPGPIGQTGWPSGYPWGTSRPGPDLYTDSVVKLSPQGKLLWYYQLTPHDLYD